MTYGEWLQNSINQLRTAGIATARLDALVLLEDASGQDRSHILIHADDALPDNLVTELQFRIDRRSKHEPLAFIRNQTEFYGRTFYIDHRVLEPRPESETMIDLIKTLPVKTVLDVGTGSGALGITTALELPDSQVSLVELDDDARAVAAHNVKLFGLDLPLIKSDLLNNALGHYDALLCNLPYVPTDHTINEAAMHEPTIAIFGGDDGLDLYRQLFAAADASYILTESLPPQHAELAVIAEQHSYQLMTTEDFIQVFKKS